MTIHSVNQRRAVTSFYSLSQSIVSTFLYLFGRRGSESKW